MSVGTMPLTIHEPESMPTARRMTSVMETSPMVFMICRSNSFQLMR